MGIIKTKITDILYGNALTAFLRIFMGLLFIYSGFFKILDPSAFAKTIDLYDIAPQSFSAYGAITVPAIELLLGIFLLIGFKIKPSSLLLILIMIFFTIAIAINAARGKSFDCGCFELGKFGLSENVSIGLIFRDIIFILILVLIFRARRNYLSVDNLIEKDDLESV